MASRTDPISRTTPVRGPLIWLLLPAMGGFWFFQLFPAFPTQLLIAPALALLSWATWMAWWPDRPGIPFRTRLWSGVYCGTVLLFAWTLHERLAHPLQMDPGIWAQLPPAEVTLDLEWTRVFRRLPEDRWVGGLAKIRRGPPNWPELEGALVSVRAFLPESMRKGGSNPFLPSAQVRMRGVIVHLDSGAAPNPGSEEFYDFLRQSGVSFLFTRGQLVEIVQLPRLHRRIGDRMNHRVRSFLHPSGEFSPQHARSRIYLAMLLGNTAYLLPDQAESFRHSGTMHLFAVSGLHIGVVAAILLAVLQTARVPMSYRPWIALPILALFVLTTGSSHSAVRAFLMITCFWLGTCLGRRSLGFAALVASAGLVHLLDRHALASPGFQLSYAVVASILLFGLPLAETVKERFIRQSDLPEVSKPPLRRRLENILCRGVDSAAISLAAFLGSAPLVVAYFGHFSPYSIILNIILVLLAFPVIAAGMTSILAGCLGVDTIVSLSNGLALAVISIMDALVHASLRLPGSVWFTGAVPGIAASAALLVYLSGSPALWPSMPTRPRFLIGPAAIGIFLLSVILL